MRIARVVVYGGLVAFVLWAFVWPAYEGRFVRADSATAFSWNPAAFMASRGNCHTRGTARTIRAREKWSPGRGRYILTLRDTSGTELVRGKLWLSDDPDFLRYASPAVAGYGAIEADFSAIAAGAGAPAAARRTEWNTPGVLLRRDTIRGRYWMAVSLSPDSTRPLRLEIDHPGGDGFSGAWFLGDSVMRGGFCAGWIEV